MSHDIAARIQALLDEADRPTVLVEDVTRVFRRKVLSRCRHNSGRYNTLTRLLDLIDDWYCDQPADSFGPKRLERINKSTVRLASSG